MIYVMLPAYNEEGSIASVITRIAGALEKTTWSYRIVIINDGSRDKTLEIITGLAKDLPVDVVSHPVNKGVGQVFTTGFGYITQKACAEDIIIAMEADDTSDPALLPVMIRKIEKEGFDVVCASRYIGEGCYQGFPPFRLFLSKAANFILSLYFRVPGIKDYTIFFRAYRADVLQKAIDCYKNKFIQSRGFVCNAEILIKLAPFTQKCTEIPFIYRYDMKKGRSKLKIIITIKEYLKFILSWRRKKKIF